MKIQTLDKKPLKKEIKTRFGISIPVPIIKFIERKAIEYYEKQRIAEKLRERDRLMSMNLGYDD